MTYKTFDNFYIVRQHPRLIDYVDSLQRKNAEALSFYPRQVFEREQQNGRIFLGILNNEPAGYIYVGSGKNNVLSCHQVCIQYDARRQLYGAALVSEMEAYAVDIGASMIKLRCGFDLDANKFWQSLGYSCVNVVNGGVRRMRRINIWNKVIGPYMFDLDITDPEVGRTSATLWRKNRVLGITTQFNRGKSLLDYRALVLGGDNDNTS